MIEEAIRPWLQKKYLDDSAKLLINLGLSDPNKITMLSCLSGLLFFPLLLCGYKIFSVIALLLSGCFDILDGSVARMTDRTSDVGTVFDIMSDRIVELGVVLGLFFISPESRALASLIMLGSMLLCITSFLVVGIVSDKVREKTFDYSPGLMERPEAFIFFILMVFLPEKFNVLAAVFSILVFYTAINRVIECSKFLNKKNH